MSKFKLPTRKLDLSFLGEDWKDCYILFRPIVYSEVKAWAGIKMSDNLEEQRKTNDQILAIIQDKFVEGFGINEKGEKVALKKEDLTEFPMDFFTEMVSFLVGKSQAS